ncbi:hypothetical protein Tco_0959939 [Tanacetum coccineum]
MIQPFWESDSFPNNKYSWPPSKGSAQPVKSTKQEVKRDSAYRRNGVENATMIDSNSDLEFVVEDISSDKANVTKNADEAKKADIEKETEEQVAEEHVAEKQAGEKNLFTSQFLNDNTKVTLNEVLKDPVEPEVQSMVDVPVTQKSKRPESQVDVGELDNRVTILEKKVHAMSSFNIPDAIDKSFKFYLKNILPKDVPDFGKIKIEKAKESMPKHSSTLFDQAALDEFKQKDKFF